MSKKAAIPNEVVTQSVELQPQKSAQDIMAEIMLEERAEKIAKAAAEKASHAQKLAVRQKNEKAIIAKDNRKYANCDHLQGNHKRGEAPMRRISALYEHLFNNGVNRYRCLKCGFRWFQQDTQEYIIRNGKKEENPTKMSYADATRHTIENSGFGSNKPSKAWVRVNVTQTLANPTE
jgi:hypothetical protein